MASTRKIPRFNKIMYAAEELGAARAAAELRANPNVIPCAHLFGASKSDGTFKTRKAAEQFARRMEMMSAFVAGKLGKKDKATC